MLRLWIFSHHNMQVKGPREERLARIIKHSNSRQRLKAGVIYTSKRSI